MAETRASIGEVKTGLGGVRETLGTSIEQVKPVVDARNAVGEQLNNAKEILDQALGALGLGSTKNEEGQGAIGEVKKTVTTAHEQLKPHGLDGSNRTEIQQIPGRVAGLHEGLDGTNGVFVANHGAIDGLAKQIQGVQAAIGEELDRFMGANQELETAHPQTTGQLIEDIRAYDERL